MEEILKALDKVSKAEDAALVGVNRAASNINLGMSIVAAIRQQNLGDNVNAICDALTTVGQKAKLVINR